MKIKIAPSILACDFAAFGAEVKRLEDAGADMVHVDIMDGHFVPNISFGPDVVKALKRNTSLTLDVHLMIENPEKYIDEFAKAGADIICIHAEATRHLNRAIQIISERNIIPAVSLNPATPLSAVEWVLKDIGMVLIMSVNPGFGGQKYIESSTDKIRDLRYMIERKGLSTDIEVDGGVSLNNIDIVTEAGANVIVSGSAIFGADDMAGYISKMKEKAKEISQKKG